MTSPFVIENAKLTSAGQLVVTISGIVNERADEPLQRRAERTICRVAASLNRACVPDEAHTRPEVLHAQPPACSVCGSESSVSGRGLTKPAVVSCNRCGIEIEVPRSHPFHAVIAGVNGEN